MMEKLFGKTLGWILWVVFYFGIRLPLILAGLVVFPIAYLFRDGDHLPALFWIWDNKEDGIYGIPWWIKKNGGEKNFKTAYGWSALRNPANNMRFISLFSLNRDDYDGEPRHLWYGDKELPHPRTARELGGSVWHCSYVRKGVVWYPSFWYIKATGPDTHFRIRLGWKCTWDWIQDKDLSASGKYSGFAFQLMPKRKG